MRCTRHSCYNFSSVYVHAFCMRASVQICQGHNFYIYAGFQNNLVQLFSLNSRSAISKIFSGRLKVKVILKDLLPCWVYKNDLRKYFV